MNAKNAMSTVENLKLQAANDDSLMGNDKNVVSSLGNQVVEYLNMHMQNPQNPLRM
jgi:hypothetical protein